MKINLPTNLHLPNILHIIDRKSALTRLVIALASFHTSVSFDKAANRNYVRKKEAVLTSWRDYEQQKA